MAVLHQRVRDDLVSRIAAGEWRAGDLIPSEPELQRHYDVSRTTVRRAVADLVADGRVRVVHGQGTRVADPWFAGGGPVGFSASLRDSGGELGLRDLGCEAVPAPAAVAGELGLAPGVEVVELERIRSLDGTPISHSTTWLSLRGPASAAGEAFAARASLYDVLAERFGVVIATTSDTFDVMLADPGLAMALGVGEGTPLLSVLRRSLDDRGRPVEFSRIACRTDRYHHTVIQRRH